MFSPTVSWMISVRKVGRLHIAVHLRLWVLQLLFWYEYVCLVLFLFSFIITRSFAFEHIYFLWNTRSGAFSPWTCNFSMLCNVWICVYYSRFTFSNKGTTPLLGSWFLKCWQQTLLTTECKLPIRQGITIFFILPACVVFLAIFWL